MHAVVGRRERVVFWQRGLGVRAREVDRAGIAGDHVAVGVLDRDGQAEGYAGADAGRGTDEELAPPPRLPRAAAVRAGEAGRWGCGPREVLRACPFQEER